jgi:type IX secretion system PorP/SprF family membrane protein
MKRIAFLLFFIFTRGLVFPQVKPYYSQYVLNNYILNPAVAGIENYTDVKLSYRNQWTGIEGAPVTTYFSIHGPIGKSDYKTSATSFELPGENPRGRKFSDNYTAPNAHHGIGITALNDKTGFINRWSAYGSYAYHQPLSVSTSLSAGINMGVTGLNLDRSKLNFADLDANDPAIGFINGDVKMIKPELGAGLWLYGADYFAGIAVQNMLLGNVKFNAGDKNGNYFSPNYFLSGGYRFFITDEVTALPSVMVQYLQPQLYGLHSNIKLQYLDKLWVGGSYRFSDLISGYAAMVGFNVSNTFNISYAYENTIGSQLKIFTKNTHEIVLVFLLGNKYGDFCPRNVW